MADEPNKEPFPGIPLGDGRYLLTEEELKDFTILRPGLPDYGSPEMTTLPVENIMEDTVLAPVDIVLFYDRRSHYPIDESGCNQWAFVVDENKALYLRGLVHELKLKDIPELPNAKVVRRIPDALMPFVAPMLLRYRWRPWMFRVCINFLQGNNYVPFLEGAFFPPEPVYANDQEYEEAWERMVNMLEPRDGILTFDRQSLISKIIAITTHGPFSHAATYAGDGIISEIVTSGTQMVPLNIYKSRRYRVAAYRHYGKLPNTTEEMIAEMRAEDGRPGYSYLGAIHAGLLAFVGKHREAHTPNSLVLGGLITFIAQA